MHLASIWCRPTHTGHGGHGVAIYYVNRNVDAKVFDLTDFSVELDLELAATHLVALGWIVVSVYRPPPSGNMENFHSKFDGCLHFLNRLGARVFIFGDYNIHFDYRNDNEL